MDKLIALGVVAVLLLVILAACVVPVDQGETCVVTQWGAVVGRTNPGLNIRVPIMQGFNCFATRGSVYEASDEPSQSKADYKDIAVNAQTSDGQQIVVKYSVRFNIPYEKSISVYSEVGRGMQDVVERVIKFHSRSLVRLMMQDYPAGKLYSGNIIDVEQNIESKLREPLEAKGVYLEAFALRKIDFDDNYVETIEQKQIEKEKITTASYQADQATNKAREAQELAKGQASAEIERAKGEAQAIQLRGDALRKYPEVLTLNFIQQLTNVEWGFLPSDTVTPLLQLPHPTRPTAAPTK